MVAGSRVRSCVVGDREVRVGVLTLLRAVTMATVPMTTVPVTTVWRAASRSSRMLDAPVEYLVGRFLRRRTEGGQFHVVSLQVLGRLVQVGDLVGGAVVAFLVVQART